MIARWQRLSSAIVSELGSSPRALTSYELADKVGVGVQFCTQILHALEDERAVMEAGTLPSRTGKPVPLWRLARWSSLRQARR